MDPSFLIFSLSSNQIFKLIYQKILIILDLCLYNQNYLLDKEMLSSKIKERSDQFQKYEMHKLSDSSFRQINSKIKNPQIQININDRFDTQMLRIKVQQVSKIINSLWHLTQEELIQVMSTYQPLPYSHIRIDELTKSQNCKLIKSSQNKIYLGQTKNKKKHGIGLIFLLFSGLAIYKQGKIYEGSYIDNQKSGYGVEVYRNGNIYIGDFHQNKKHGKGVFFWFNLSQIPCTKNSQIVIQHYKGSWWGGLPDGQGQHYKSNGDIYIGKFKNGLKHGNGMENYANGDFYQGQFVNGLPQGYGQYIWSDGSQYKGDFKQGYRNGYGIWKNNKHQDQIYQGHYMLDKKHGYGIYNWGNGYSYKGNYSEDMRSGQGKLFYQDQLIYQGKWIDGQKQQEIGKSPKKKRDILTGKKSTHQTSLTQSSNLKNKFMNSKQKISESNSMQKSTPAPKKSSVQRNKKSLSSKNRPDTYCVSFRTQQKIRIGHRNCVPCKILKQRKNSESKLKTAKILSRNKY